MRSSDWINIVQSNNEAVSLLQAGAYADAVRLFRQGLVLLHDLLAADPPPSHHGVPTSGEQPIDNKDREMSTASDCGGRRFLEAVPIGSTSPDPSQFFSCAFIISCESDDESLLQVNDDLYHMAASVYLFNFAVSFHYNGVVLGSSVSMERALHYYDLSYTAIYLCENEYAPRSIVAARTFLLAAIANNTGHVHSSFFNSGMAGHCHELLFDLLESNDGYGDHDACMPPEAYLFFKTSLLYSKYDNLMAPAA